MEYEVYAVVGSIIIASIGLFFTARAWSLDRDTRELQLVEGILKELRKYEEEHYVKYQKFTEIEKNEWSHLFFNTLEWFSFLINTKKIKNKEIKKFFDSAIIFWYEEMFLKNMNNEIIEDKKRFTEFKKIYKKIKT